MAQNPLYITMPKICYGYMLGRELCVHHAVDQNVDDEYASAWAEWACLI